MYFKNIEYLKDGNDKQKHAYATLSENRILKSLQQYDPILVGTIPIGIDIESSDLDIICCYSDLVEFTQTVETCFGRYSAFRVRKRIIQGGDAIVANFDLNGFSIEVFGQDTPTRQQMAYRHMIIENRLLNELGESFRQQIIGLKRMGYKTEPAFAYALGIAGDPYTELLSYENL